MYVIVIYLLVGIVGAATAAQAIVINFGVAPRRWTKLVDYLSLISRHGHWTLPGIKTVDKPSNKKPFSAV